MSTMTEFTKELIKIREAMVKVDLCVAMIEMNLPVNDNSVNDGIRGLHEYRNSLHTRQDRLFDLETKV